MKSIYHLIFSLWGAERVFALYQRHKVVGFFLVTYLTAELAVALWIYSTPGAHRMWILTPFVFFRLCHIDECIVRPLLLP